MAENNSTICIHYSLKFLFEFYTKIIQKFWELKFSIIKTEYEEWETNYSKVLFLPIVYEKMRGKFFL